MDPNLDEQPKIYTPFTGLMILLVAFGLYFGAQINTLSLQDNEVRSNIALLGKDAEKGQRAEEHLASLINDLRQTAASDPKAVQVLGDFNIPVNPDHN